MSGGGRLRKARSLSNKASAKQIRRGVGPSRAELRRRREPGGGAAGGRERVNPTCAEGRYRALVDATFFLFIQLSISYRQPN